MVNGKGEAKSLPNLALDTVTILACGASVHTYTGLQIQGQEFAGRVWAVNLAARAFKHDLAWNMHDLNVLKELEPELPYIKHYKKLKTKLVTVAPVPGLDTLIYPIKKVIEYWQDAYFFGAIPYMLAYAGMCGVKHVNLFGADFDYADRNDYEAGRACVEYWMGRLRQKGVDFGLPHQSTLRDNAWPDGRPVAGKGRSYGKIYGYFDKQPDIDVSTGKLVVK